MTFLCTNYCIFEHFYVRINVKSISHVPQRIFSITGMEGFIQS